jgi:glycosyltransferase involved in cell wall biosynthesis
MKDGTFMNTIKRRVLQIITLGEIGGAQTHLLDIIKNLKDCFDFHVAVGEPGYLAESLRNDEITIHRIPSLQRDISFINDFEAYRDIYRLIRSIQPNLVCTHSSKAGFIGRKAAYKLGIPAVFTAHGWAFTDGVDSKRQKLYLRLEKMAARWCNRIICVSEYDRQLALKCRVAPDNKLVTIHNGITADASPYSKSENHPLIITMVARFSEQKDHALLLNAVRDIDIRNIKVQLVGDGPLLPNIKSLAESLNIGDRVQFLGNRRDVPELLTHSDIFVLTSKWEGFPITILEAMRAGLPVICSDVGGCSEAIKDGENGFLVPRGDGVVLANRLKQLIKDKDLRYKMGQKGRMSFEKCFTVEKMAEKTERIYREIIGF